MEFSLEEYLGAIAFVMGVVGTWIYIRSILKGHTKPHLYTWITFSILTGIALFAQLFDHAGPGAWMMVVTVLSCIAIALLSLKYGEQNITRSDKIALTASLSAIIPWLMTDDPLLSVIMISIIDMVGMYPTIRKSWHKPYEEKLVAYNIATVKTMISLFALTNVTLVTTLYSISFTLVNIAFVALCLYRRHFLRNAPAI